MVYHGAAKKTGAYMVLSLILGLSIVTFFTSDLTPTGRVTSPGLVTGAEAAGILPFVLGFMVGALMVGTYFYIVHIERKR